jgi:hypothetical protein
MSRKTVYDAYYTFNPATKTIVVNKGIPRERLVLITDVTTNQVLYNFSDPNLKATTYTVATDNGNQANVTTTIVLQYNTTALANTDKLQIVVDEYDESFKPAETQLDPVNKFRVSEGQALIDTDFEYSTQFTKWENLAMINNKPFAYYTVGNTITITDVTATTNMRSLTVNTYPQIPPAIGTPFYMQDTLWAPADGLFIVDSNNSTTNTFTYTARTLWYNSTQSILNPNVTVGYYGYTFTNAAIPITSINNGNTTITVQTSVPHGLSLGNEIALTGVSGTSSPPNGSWIVSTIINPYTFVFYSTYTPIGPLTGGTLYVRPQGQSVHRAFDGGVRFGCNATSHGHQMIRQTRRQFRYQSGKSIQMSTGTVMRPNIDIDSMTSSGVTITVTTKSPHFLTPNVAFSIRNANDAAYNGTFIVQNVLDFYRFTYQANSTPVNAQAGGQYQLSILNWYGGGTRVGLFNDQNGVFFEYDGQTLYAVRRTSTYQLSGTVSCVSNSALITANTNNGATTVFTKQLTPGDYIVLKGMTYKVVNILSDTQLTITPPFRGLVNLNNDIVSKTVDLKYPQSIWNMDRCDGTGPSGYNLDLSKMQMFYLDYSWYGAGYIRFGFRASDGNIVYCHKILNNNTNYEAYMRSGNLPGRYETNTFSKQSVLAATLNSTDTTVSVADTTGFPPNGTVFVNNNTQMEFINYQGITNNVLQNCVRGQAGANTLTAALVAGSPTASISSSAGLQLGQFVQNPGIYPSGAFISGIVPNFSVTLSQASLITGTFQLLFAPMANTATTFTYSSSAPTVVAMHAPQFASEISHWGTSVMMDGKFDNDPHSYIFTKGMTSALSINYGQTNAVMSFRISPSVSNGIAGTALGIREIVNRMQMVFTQMDVFSNGQFLIQFLLNGTVSSSAPNWSNVGGSSLAQYIFHNPATTVAGGESIFGFFLNTTGGTNYTTTQQDLSLVRDLGTSILSGGFPDPTRGIYPDGPDILTVVATNLATSGSSNIFARMSWQEAQA